jgi:hypothetical protein
VATQTLARTKLECLVESFDSDATAGSRNQIRELLENDPRSFQDGIARVLRSSSTSRAVQFVVGLLVTSDSLMPTLCNPALNLEEAVSLARTALQTDPMTDVNLAKKLADATGMGEPVANAGRLMDILGEISNGNRIASSLMRLWRSSDPQMRSKAVLLIGRGSKNLQWVQSRLAETDPRIRANAVEALWGVDTAEAKDLLRAAARDDNNRVAGNALFALYGMGDASVISELFKLAASDSPQSRSSGAWAMGETGDPRFSETVGRMVGEPNAIVRKRAFAALSRLKAAAKTRQGREWRVAGRLLPGSGSMRQVSLDASPADGSAPPRLLATQFILSEDGQLITNYQVETRAPAETLAVTFLFPHSGDSGSPPWVQGAIDCLQSKRPGDLWCATFYLPAGETPQGAATPPQFNADREAAAAALQKLPGNTECAPFWDSLRNSVQAVTTPSATTPAATPARHLIVYNQSSGEAPAGMAEIVAAAVASNVTVQVVSLTPSAPLEELCRSTQGSFQLAQSEDELSKLVGEAHLTLLSRFLVGYQPAAPGARTLSVRVFDSTGWGETTISLPAPG